MIKVSTTGMVVSLKTDLRFPIPGQWGHGDMETGLFSQSDFGRHLQPCLPFRTIKVTKKEGGIHRGFKGTGHTF